MSRATETHPLRVIETEGWPGGRRIIEGVKPRNCIHRRPLQARVVEGDKDTAREQLCRLCVFEVPRFQRRE